MLAFVLTRVACVADDAGVGPRPVVQCSLVGVEGAVGGGVEQLVRVLFGGLRAALAGVGLPPVWVVREAGLGPLVAAPDLGWGVAGGVGVGELRWLGSG